MTLEAIAEKLASALRTHAKCQCETKAFWPWKREVVCARCEALALYDATTKPPLVGEGD